MNSRGKHETEYKTMEIQTYIHAFITRKLHNYYKVRRISRGCIREKGVTDC